MREKFFYWRHKKCVLDIVSVPNNWPRIGHKCRVHQTMLVLTWR